MLANFWQIIFTGNGMMYSVCLENHEFFSDESVEISIPVIERNFISTALHDSF